MYRFAYYPGCSLEGTAKEYNLSTKAVCKALGIELVELPDWNCCGATSAHSTNYFLSIALPARNLIKAGELNLNLAIPCSACFNRMKTSDYHIKEDKRIKEEIEKLLGRKYIANSKINHLLEIFAEDKINAIIASKVAKPLQGLKIAPYYGCLLVKPPKIVEFENAEDPQSLDNLIVTLGGEAISDFAYKTECCGASLTLTREEIVLELVNKILKDAQLREADCLVTVCPFCHFNLDAKQRDVKRKFKENYNLPIFYFTQLIGLALGISSKELGIDKHFVNPMELLKRLELA